MYTGSMLGSGALMFAVWPYVISHMMPNRDRTYFTVELNTELMAILIGEKEEDIIATVEKCCQPDPKSRTPDKDGRRLVRLGNYLYEVVNGRHYDQVKRAEDLREGNRERQEIYREKKKAVESSTGNNGEPAPKRVKFVKPTAEEANLYATKLGLPTGQVKSFMDYWDSVGWKRGANRPVVDWQATMRTWKTNWETRRGATGKESEDVPYGKKPFNLADSL